MKKVFKKIYVLIYNCIDTIVSVLSVLVYSSFRCNKKIKRSKSIYKKYNECIVMGNGPSLKSSLFERNFDKTSCKQVFAVNFFCITSFFYIAKPSFYVLLDPNLFNENLKDQTNELIKQLNLVSWPMVLFIPYRFIRFSLIKQINNRKIEVVPFNSTPVQGNRMIENFLFKKNLGMPMPQTVINAAIFLALNMDFKIIHLYGVEQSWLKYLTVHQNNKISVGLKHFYEGSDETRENRTLSEFLLSQVAVFKSHMRLQEYSIYLGKSIFNHTPGSYIDAFERVDP